MMPSLNNDHVKNAQIARQLYLDSRTADAGANEWHAALMGARRMVLNAIKASGWLQDVAAALEVSGQHMRVFRHFMAPPTSQDQFLMLCNDWSKATEKSGKGIAPGKAASIAAVFNDWRDPAIGTWLREERPPRMSELRMVLNRISPLIANQDLATVRRNLWASRQEKDVIDLLEHKGWTKAPSSLVDTRASVKAKHFMHKTRFDTKTLPQEADIACGLNSSYVLAMECKVTNDETNSIKRINDISKKAAAWHAHWGSFVETAAMLQGVIAAKDVQRLADEGVHIFWSHDLKSFSNWLDTRT